MSKCDWCNNDEELQIYKDGINKTYNICKNCYNKVVIQHKCRRCGKETEPELMINGLCTECIQMEMQNKSRLQEEQRLGVDREAAEELSSNLELTGQDYDNWMTMGKTFSTADLKNPTLKRLWIMVKLNSSGIYDDKLISQNFKYIETILDRSASKLENNKCKIIIANTQENINKIKASKVIDKENQVYIIQA